MESLERIRQAGPSSLSRAEVADELAERRRKMDEFTSPPQERELLRNLRGRDNDLRACLRGDLPRAHYLNQQGTVAAPLLRKPCERCWRLLQTRREAVRPLAMRKMVRQIFRGSSTI